MESEDRVMVAFFIGLFGMVSVYFLVAGATDIAHAIMECRPERTP